MSKDITIKLSSIQQLIVLTALENYAYKIKDAQVRENDRKVPIISYEYALAETEAVIEQINKCQPHEKDKDS